MVAGPLVTLALIFCPPAEAACFQVIVNASNTFSEDKVTMKRFIKRLYLRQQTIWPNAQESTPFGRPANSPIYQAFVENVLGMTREELNYHWKRLKQTTGETPPRAVEAVRMLLRQVSKKKGAFSVMGADEARKIPAKVRILFKFCANE